MKNFDGYLKQKLGNDYVLLAGGDHKALNEFSMAHSHPYLPLSGGTMTGIITGNTGNGLIVQSANTGSWKEGIRVYPASNNYSLISLQDSTSDNVFAMVTNVSSHIAYFDYRKDGVNTSIYMPYKSGTIALLSDLPTKASWNYDDVYVKKTGDTMTGTLYMNLPAESWSLQAICAKGGTSGRHAHVGFGVEASTCNMSYISHHHVADGSTSNYLTMGLYGKDELLNILANGNVGIGTTSPSAKLHINGTVKSQLITVTPTGNDCYNITNSSGTVTSKRGYEPTNGYSYWSAEQNGYEIRIHDNGGLKFAKFKGSPTFVYDILHSGNYTSWVYSKTDSDDRYVNITGDTMTGALIINAAGSQSNSPLAVGYDSAHRNINASVADQTTMIQIIAGTGGTTNSSAIGFHNPGISSAVLEYKNVSASIGYFNFRSDNVTWNVGIGTTTPSYKLTVMGDIQAVNNAQEVGIRVRNTNTAASSWSIIRMGNGSYDTGPVMFFNSASRTDDGGANTFTIRNDVGKVRIGNTSYATWFPGSVGIGTDSPSHKLHTIGKVLIEDNVTGGGTTNSLLNILYNGTHEYGVVMKIHSYGNDSPGIRFSHSTSADDLNLQVNTNWTVGMYSSDYNKFAITQDRGTSGWGTARVVIDNTGRVGINNVSPISKLTIDHGTTAQHTLVLQRSPLTDAPIAPYADRPSLVLAGPYPALVLFAGGVSNANHGATISMGGYDSDNATSGTYKTFTIGTPNYNVRFMEIGYGTNENPHLNGMHGNNYTSGGTSIMRFWNNGNVGIGTSINTVSHRLDVRATDSEVLRLSSATNHGRIQFFRSTSTLGAMWGTYGPGAYNYFSNEIGKYEMRLYDNGGLKYGYYPSNTMYDILLSYYGGQVIFYKTGYSTNCALVVGGTANNVNPSVCSWMTSMIQIDAGSGGATLGCGIAFHNPGISSAGFGYKNSDANTGYFDFSSDDSSWSVKLNANTYAANYYTTSDARKKQNIHKISDNIKQFEWKETGETSYGFVAQDLEVKHPELVNDDGNMKTVNYNAALSLVVAKLENRVKELEAKLGLETPPPVYN